MMLAGFLPGRKLKGRERRRAARTPLGTIGQLVLCPSSSRTAPLKVQVTDCSATGVGIVHDEPLPQGQKYVVKEGSISKRKSVLFTVVRCDQIEPGRFSIGLHASHLLENGYMHSHRTPEGRRVPAKMLAFTIVLGVAGFIL